MAEAETCLEIEYFTITITTTSFNITKNIATTNITAITTYFLMAIIILLYCYC